MILPSETALVGTVASLCTRKHALMPRLVNVTEGTDADSCTRGHTTERRRVEAHHVVALVNVVMLRHSEHASISRRTGALEEIHASLVTVRLKMSGRSTSSLK